jgi:hypothetical protein
MEYPRAIPGMSYPRLSEDIPKQGRITFMNQGQFLSFWDIPYPSFCIWEIPGISRQIPKSKYLSLGYPIHHAIPGISLGYP